MKEYMFKLRWLASEDERFPGFGAVLSLVALVPDFYPLWMDQFMFEAAQYGGYVFVGLDRRFYIRFDDGDSAELEHDLGVFESIAAERFDERMEARF